MPYFTLSTLLAALDLLLKHRIEKQSPEEFPRDLEHTKGLVKLYRNHNDGFPFGFLRQYPEVIRMVPFGVISAIAGMLAGLSKEKGNIVKKLGLAMILGGGISNLYDRFVRHYVIDYFSFQYGVLKKVVFNLGDLFILLGSMIAMLTETQTYCTMENKLSIDQFTKNNKRS